MNNNTSINPPLLIDSSNNFTTWNEWLAYVETNLKALNYTKFIQNLNNEDFAYWKTFYIDNEKAYQVGIFFYDFRKYQENYNTPERIAIQYECHLLNGEGRIDLSVFKNITLEEFEDMSKTFYDTMHKYKN